jgi:hypothetical protein
MKETWKISALILGAMLAISHSLFAQDNSESKEHKPQIRGAIMMANSHVPNSFLNTKTTTIMPTWGMDLDYFFHKRWSVAMQGDIKLQSFQVKEENKILERKNPVALAFVLHYHMLKHWSFFAGPGYEIEEHENLRLLKLGTEYSFEVNEDFEIALNLMYENKQEVYDTWTFGIAFNKRLWRK